MYGRNFGQLFQEHQNTWSYSPDKPKLAEISARSFKTSNNVTEMDTYDGRHAQRAQVH